MSSLKAVSRGYFTSGVCLFLMALSIMFWLPPVVAQQVTPEALDKLRQLQEQKNATPTIEISPLDQARQGDGIVAPDIINAETVVLPGADETNKDMAAGEEPSRLEEDYSERAGDDLRLYGYDIFDNVPKPGDVATGRIPDNYVLGIGDELVFTFHGSTKRTVLTRVDREGRVIVPDLRPIVAAGRTYADFRSDVEARTATALLGTEVFVSLGSVRMMSVMVLGEVYKPGLHRMTSLATAIEALGVAGGIKKTGSLRAITIIRGGTRVGLDLYEIFTGGDGTNVNLQDGDRIVVPIIGATVALTGEVKRPAIYELSKGQSKTGMDRLITLAGGTLRPRGYAYSRTTFDDTGRQQILDVPGGRGEAMSGDIISVRRKENIQIGGVTLSGHVRVEGKRSLAAAPNVSNLIRDIYSLQPNPYLPFAVVETTDPQTQSRVFEPINLEHVLAGRTDYALKDRDNLIVFSATDVEFLSTRAVRTVILTGKAASNMCPSLKRLAKFVSDANLDRYATAIRSFVVEAAEQFEEIVPCPDIFDDNIDLLPFVLEYVIGVNGAIRKPGVFPVTTETTLTSLIAVTGGMSNNVDKTFVELLEYKQIPERGESSIMRRILNLTDTDPAGISISPGSGVRFNALINDQERSPVSMIGEFVRPGTYTIRRGESLLELIDRAGGLTEQAFPYGAIFTRKSVSQTQQKGFQRTAREINGGLTAAALRGDVSGDALGVARDIANQLNDAVALGRVVVEADPAVLRARPALNSILEPGDRLIMPKRPSFVAVVGDVLNPASLQFFPGKGADQYIAEAGGPLKTAENNRAFVVYPNGAARPLKRRFWQTATIAIPPGSTIVVPKDVTPVNALQLTKDISTILSQLALSAASIAVINR